MLLTIIRIRIIVIGVYVINLTELYVFSFSVVAPVYKDQPVSTERMISFANVHLASLDEGVNSI